MEATHNVTFGDSQMLLFRLKDAIRKGKKFTFIIGSGASKSDKEGMPGVLDAGEIVAQMKASMISNEDGLLLWNANIDTDSAASSYQSAMSLFHKCFGQEALNEVITKAVLNARINKSPVRVNTNDLNLESLENDLDNWYLPAGVKSLGELYVDFQSFFGGPILTSNFDPLLEISISKAGGNPISVFLTEDGKFTNSLSPKSQAIIHFHGFWRNSDTLHTIEQIKRIRPLLKGDLRKHLEDNIIIVVGYGGWDDVFTRTLIELAEEGNSNCNILWTFFNSEEKDIKNNNGELLKRLLKAGNRIIFYKGIDSNELFPQVLSLVNTPQNSHEAKLDTSSVLEVPKGLKPIEEATFESDVPPTNIKWVGRKEEFSILSSDKFRVYFITGIGGQGKSGLASQYVKSLTTGYDYWDWRDCKEEDNRIFLKIAQIIERFSLGKYRFSQLQNENIESLLELLFEVIRGKKVVFVFDNVDSYIDYEEFTPIRAIGKLVKLALEKEHNSKFIFTCRPQIKYPSPLFCEIALKNLNESETLDLLIEYSTGISLNDLKFISAKAHKITNGHPLWISLIAAQALRGKSIVEKFLNDINSTDGYYASSESARLAESTLKVVWNTLNEKQQTLLRCLAENITAETENTLFSILSSTINYNQFSKSFRTLKNLNLLVAKSSAHREALYELHPLVKEYILNKYNKSERHPFITLFVKYYDQLILVLKPKLSPDSSLSVFENWTNKIELQINKDDFQSALTSLEEVCNPILSAGFVEEYLRVGTKLLNHIDWSYAVKNEMNYFHEQIRSIIRSNIDFGELLSSINYLDKYESVLQDKGSNYINYLELKSHYYWFKDDFENAIKLAETAIELVKKAGNVGITIDLYNTYALALRDSRIDENIDKAIGIFLKGENLNEILGESYPTNNLHSVLYGNVGRCLWFKKEYDKALICYKKSLEILNNETHSFSIMNRGYACFWIAELLEAQSSYYEAFIFYKECLFNWSKVSPRNARIVSTLLDKLLKEKYKGNLEIGENDFARSKYCKNYIQER